MRKLKNWFNNLPARISKRYVSNMHPVFLKLMQKSNFIQKNAYVERYEKRYNDIMNILASPRYKKFFYKVVQFDPKLAEELKVPETWYGKLFDKIAYNFSKLYVYLFAREVYNNIKSFEAVTNGIISLNKRINEYMVSTTIDERLDRASEYKIIEPKKREAQRKLRNMQTIGVNDIKIRNQATL